MNCHSGNNDGSKSVTLPFIIFFFFKKQNSWKSSDTLALGLFFCGALDRANHWKWNKIVTIKCWSLKFDIIKLERTYSSHKYHIITDLARQCMCIDCMWRDLSFTALMYVYWLVIFCVSPVSGIWYCVHLHNWANCSALYVNCLV